MSNDSSSKCPQCGAALSDSALGGLCPSCLMSLNLKTETVLSGEAATAQAPLPPEQIAPHFPQLEILECLGRGGMGVVYKARQKTLNRVVALKLLAPERVGDSKFAERFAREAQALAALNHPNIVTVHDFGQAGGFYYLLMEFVDGVNLRQLLRTRKFTPEEALAIVPPLCDALQFAHERGIVHRDIKPENLLLDKAGRVKIADFGIAKMLDANSGSASAESAPTETSGDASKLSDSSDALTAGQVLGTRGYSAPEQMNAEHVDSRADIYSLGVVFYEMLTGELPGKKIEPPSRKVQIDVRLDAVVLRALEKTPELRWQTAADLRTQVETIVETPSGKPEASEDTKSLENDESSLHRKRLGRWGVLVRSAFVGLFVGLLVFAAASTVTNLLHNVYCATVRIKLLTQTNIAPVVQLARLQKQVQQPEFIRAVAQKLSLNSRWPERLSGSEQDRQQQIELWLHSAVRLRPIGSNDLFYLEYFDVSPRFAAEIANAFAEECKRQAGVKVVEPAMVPDEPVRPKPQLNLAIGLAVGALVGIATSALTGWILMLRNRRAPRVVSSAEAIPSRRPWQLVAVGVFYILGGCLSALEIGSDFSTGTYNFNFGVMALPIGIGLLRLRPWWRKAAITCALIEVTLGVCGFVVALAMAGHSRPGELPGFFSLLPLVPATARGIIGAVLLLGFLMWQVFVLMRTDTKALFKKRGFSRPYLEWAVLLLALTFSFGCAAVFKTAGKSGKALSEAISEESSHRPDRVRKIEDGRFVAQLPDNGSVELLAVHPHPATNSGWWKPDGAPSQFGSDIQTEAEENHVGGVVALVRVQWPNRYESWPRPYGAMSNVTSVTLKGGIGFLTRSGQRYFSDDVSAMYFEQAALFDDHATLFMEVATGEWRTLITQRPGFLNYIFSGYARKEWSFSETPDGNLKVTIRHLVENAQHEYRLVAVDVDGMEYLPKQTSRKHVSTDTFSTFEAVFGPVSGSGKMWNLPLNRVREVRWEFRPYEMVEFRNVSLKPRHRTTVEVRDFGDQDSEPTQISSKTNSTDNASGFGPVMECVVEECVNPDFKWFDLDTGKHFIPPKSTEDEDDSVFEDWLRRTGADFGAGPRGLVARGGGFEAIPVKPEFWETAKSDAVRNLLAQTRPGGEVAWMPDDQTNSTPATYVFKTREGEMGILQILSGSENPRGIKIRYKLVEPDTEAIPPSVKLDGASKFTRTEIITITGDGSLTVAGEACPLELLSERLKQFAVREPASVEIRADKAALMKWFMAVAKACEKAGLRYSAVATDGGSADTTAGNDDKQPSKRVLGRLQMIAGGAYRNLAIARTESVCGFPWHEIVARYSGPELTEEEWNSSKTVVDGSILSPSPAEEDDSRPEPISTFCVSLDVPHPKASSCWYPAPNECQLRFALPNEKDAKDAAQQMNIALSKPVALVEGKRILLFTVGERKAWLEVREPQLPKAKLAFITSETWNCGDWPRAGWSPIERGTNAVNSGFRIESAVLMTRPRSILNVVAEHDPIKGGSSNVFSMSITNNTSQAGLYWLTWFPGSVSNLSANGWGVVLHDARTAKEIGKFNFTEPMPTKWRPDWYYSSVVTNTDSLQTVLLINDGRMEPGNAQIPNAILRLKLKTLPLEENH